MSLEEIYNWVVGIDFLGFQVIWTWLISAPWWMAIGTVLVAIFVFRIIWDLIIYFLNWLFDWTFKAGLRCGEWLQIIKGYTISAIELGKLIKSKFIR